jgi:hypothetical protein
LRILGKIKKCIKKIDDIRVDSMIFLRDTDEKESKFMFLYINFQKFSMQHQRLQNS